MIELKEFQLRASTQIAERFARYFDDQPLGGTTRSPRVVPFYQSLDAITASGKTVILADTVAAIAAGLPLPPLVLWLSKGKVVVDQTYANLAAGGKYNHLLGPARFSYLAQYEAADVRDAREPRIYFATVGTFNQRQKEKGERLIFRSEIDTAEDSVWNELKVRTDAAGIRRNLLIVYDEGHNLTDQQMNLLLELQPDALIAASATMRLPQSLMQEVKGLKEVGWTDQDLVTHIPPGEVAESGLVKSTILLGGYEAPMEGTIDSLISDMADAEAQARAHDVGAPKAIYVCKTNIVEGDSFLADDPKQPFLQRRSPPILIWRYLTERCGVNPAEVAVYASLKTHRSYPLPSEFRLFKGGDKDYAEFTAGEFRHVIFNQSLQEGWDDPLCYFAYIDKSMGSNIQVEQVIGRLLRQPGAVQYPSERLNSAHFYIRVDRKGVFNELLEQVGTKLAAEAPEVRVVEIKPGKAKPEPIPAKEERLIYETGYDANAAVEPIAGLLDGLMDYHDGVDSNISSAGGRALIQRQVGEPGTVEFEWEEFETSNVVSVRWLFRREILRRFPLVLGVTPTSDRKFDAMVGFGSRAHTQVRQVAQEIVSAYVDHVDLKQKAIDGYVVGPAMIRHEELERFQNALHEGYSGLNSLERQFARAIDKVGVPWFRNPPRSGYNIPLVSMGPTRNFYPDFMVWQGDDLFAVDTTGGHLLKEKTNRKLLSISPAKGAPGKLLVRFVSEGRWNDDVEQEDSSGFTVWGRKPDGALRVTHVESIDAAVERALAGS